MAPGGTSALRDQGASQRRCVRSQQSGGF